MESRKAYSQPKPRKPVRDPEFLRWVWQDRRCLYCGSHATVAHHWREGGGPGQGSAGRKPDDYRVVVVCNACHDAFHGGNRKRKEWMDTQIGYEELYLHWVNNVCDWWAKNGLV